MNNKINLDVNVVDILYRKYKQFLFPIGVIIVCLLLFILVIIPQIQNYFLLSDQTGLENQKLLNIRNNISFLANLDDNKLSGQAQTASSVLPQDKDFTGILFALSAASAKSSTLLGNYSFTVGTLGEKNIGSGFPFVTLTIQLNSNVLNTIKFIDDLYKTAPIAEVKKISTDNEDSQVTINFFYQPEALGAVDQTVPLLALSPKQVALINTLSTWSNASPENTLIPFTSLPQASPSANPFGF